MADERDTPSPDDSPDISKRPQDPLVARLRPDPSQPPEPTRSLAGLLGDSDRPGFRRLYFTPELDYYAEFKSEDVVTVADIPPDQPPLMGESATRVTLNRDAPVDIVRMRRARPVDEFDLDVVFGATVTPEDEVEVTAGCLVFEPPRSRPRTACLSRCVCWQG